VDSSLATASTSTGAGQEESVDFKVHTSREIAEQLTLVDASLYARVQPAEFADQSWLKHKERAPTLSVLANRFNQVSFWVATEVLRHSKVSTQARTVRRFIHVAQELRQLRNYNTLVAIVAGLNHSSIQRLKRCWTRIPEKTVTLFEELEELLSPLRNFKTLVARSVVVLCLLSLSLS
jgi:Rap guanine nucleotide exchange factor 2